MNFTNSLRLSSESESDDTEMCKFKEAALGCDEVFSQKFSDIEKVETKIKEGLQPKNVGSIIKAKPSLRPKEKFHEEENELETTPEFRAHVGKKLMSLVEGKVKIGNVWQIEASNTNNDEGIFKLFRDSDPNKVIDNNQEQIPRKRVFAISSSSDSESENERLAQAAISTESVLSTSAIYPKSSINKDQKIECDNASMCEENNMTDNFCGKNKIDFSAGNKISELITESLQNSKKKRKGKKKRQKEWMKNQSEKECEPFESFKNTNLPIKDSAVNFEKEVIEVKKKCKQKKKKSKKDH